MMANGEVVPEELVEKRVIDRVLEGPDEPDIFFGDGR